MDEAHENLVFVGDDINRFRGEDADDAWLRSTLALHPQAQRVAEISSINMLHVAFEIGDWFLAESESQRRLVQVKRMTSVADSCQPTYYVLASVWDSALPELDASGQLRVPADQLGKERFNDCRADLCTHLWHPLHKPCLVGTDMLYACET